MRLLLLVVLIGSVVAGFEFPTEVAPSSSPAGAAEETGTVTVEEMGTVTVEEEEVYPDEGEPLDPGADGIESRFFDRRDWQQLGTVATHFFNKLGGGRGGRPQGPPPDTGRSDSQDYSVDDYDSSPDYGPPSHGFPVDADGNIDCSRVPRHMKRSCRQARRQERREGRRQGRRPRPFVPPPEPPVSSVSGPDRRALRESQRCCPLQQKNDMISFNNCCQEFGFCPICEFVPDMGRAKAECCPLKFSGDTQKFLSCCANYGQCPACGEPPAPPRPKGCLYKGKIFPVNSVVERLAYKCMFVKCTDNGKGPEIKLEYLEQVGCCEDGLDLAPPGRTFPIDECTNRVCEDGEWVERNTQVGAVFSSRCPEGWLDLGRSCVFIWRELMTRKNASSACRKLQASLVLPQNRAQQSQLITAFVSMQGRDSKRELGGWINARDTGSQWTTEQGDTLTFTDWEEGFPDKRRLTACAGLVVTDTSQGWKDFVCNSRKNMLYPICQVPKKACGGQGSGCGPFEGDMMIPPNSDIPMFISQCEKFRCNEDGYVIRQTHPQCCYHHEWDNRPFSREQGWHAGLYPPGGFQPYEGLLCECTEGVSDCSQFFDV